jgi:hypothetical protein
MIDEDFRIWLIEVNENPYLGVPNDFIKELLPKMLDDLVQITTVNFYNNMPVDNNENHFELIYAENIN